MAAQGGLFKLRAFVKQRLSTVGMPDSSSFQLQDVLPMRQQLHGDARLGRAVAAGGNWEMEQAWRASVLWGLCARHFQLPEVCISYRFFRLVIIKLIILTDKVKPGCTLRANQRHHA